MFEFTSDVHPHLRKSRKKTLKITPETTHHVYLFQIQGTCTPFKMPCKGWRIRCAAQKNNEVGFFSPMKSQSIQEVGFDSLWEHEQSWRLDFGVYFGYCLEIPDDVQSRLFSKLFLEQKKYCTVLGFSVIFRVAPVQRMDAGQSHSNLWFLNLIFSAHFLHQI